MTFRLALSLLVIKLLVATAVADDAVSSNTSLLTDVPDSTNQILKLTHQGLQPPTLTLNRAGSSVFFLNGTSDALVNIEVEYGRKLGYCATGKMEMDADGVFRSRKPIAPKSFVSVCFPQPGSYPVRVQGIDGKTLTGSVIVR